MIKNAKYKAIQFFIRQKQLNKKSKIYKSCKSILRTDKFTIAYSNAIKCLNNIDFIYDTINNHWAETDGKSISINLYKTYTDRLLLNTLIHEAMHYIIHRTGIYTKHEVYEAKEHKIMYLTNRCLI